jgi:hypothetical protein
MSPGKKERVMTMAGRAAISLVGAALVACEPPEQIDPGKPGIDDPSPVVSVRNDRALVAWHERSPHQIKTSRYATATGFTAPSIFGAGNFPEVALSSFGRAAMLYVESSGLRATTMNTLGVWAVPTTIDAALTTHTDARYSVGVDDTGRLLAAWQRDGIRTRHKAAGGAWTPETVLDASPSSSHVQVAVNGSGAAVLGYCRGGGLFGVAYDPATGWGAPTVLATGCCSVHAPDFHVPPLSVGIAESGHGVIAASDMQKVCVRRYTPGSGWTIQTTISGAPNSHAPQVAVNSSGQVLAGWLVGTLGSKSLRVRSFTPGSGWTAILSDTSTIQVGPIGIGIGADGNGAAIIRTGSPQHMHYVTYSESSVELGAAVDLEPGLPLASYYPRAAFDPTTTEYEGMTVWQRAGNEEIWASRLGF